MSLHLSNNNNENEEKINPENLIKDGIDIIYQSFNTNMENYIVQIKELKKIINDLNKKLELMKEEIEMLQRENEYYKTQNKKLKNEVENMNKVVNNIKGKLINFDLNINPKQTVQNMSQENLEHKSLYKHNKNQRKNQYNAFHNIRNNIEQNNNTINNFNNNNNNLYRDQINKEISRNSQTIRYEIKNSNFNELINESEINSINYDDIISEINPCNTNKRQLHTLYSDLNIRNNNKIHNNNYNEENAKNNNYQNIKRKSIDYSYMNKRNINFNSYKNINTYRRKSKIKNKSLNNIMKKEKINNDIKYLIKKNSWKHRTKDKEYIKLNLNPLLEFSDNLDFNNQICKTFQNNKNINFNNNNCIKELKMKEIAFFIEKCKTYLDNEEFEIIFDIFGKYKDEIIKDKNIIKQIKFYLKSNEELLNLFNNIIL